jgi:glycosyltransferase involved in cell wall biosynthesis
MNMKILIATPLYPPEIGGPATYVKTLEVEFPRQNVHGTVLPFSCTKSFPKYLRHIAYAYHLFRASYGVDVILALDPVSVGLPSSLVALIRGKKFVVKIVGDYAWEQGQQRFGVKQNLDEFVHMPSTKFLAQVGFLRMVQTFVARRATRIIVPSKYLKGIVMAWGIPEEKISVIYNAFSGIAEMPAREVVRTLLGIPASAHVIVSAGRLVPWKGFPALIEVVEKLRENYPDIKLFIAGGGPDEEMLHTLIVEKNLVDNVLLLGNMNREILLKYVRAADCFVLNTGYEGLSHQLLEVLAVGTPIVTTNVGGNVEIIKDGETGRLVEFNDKAKLAEVIRTILNDRPTAEAMTTRGREFVAQFTVERMVVETVQLLK